MAISLRSRACAALVLALSGVARAEEREPDSAVAPGAHYQASAPFRLFFGGRWRDDWTATLRVRTLDLSAFDGGLTPLRRGGRHGQQSMSLRFKSANGTTWVFRVLDKDARKALDPELRDSLVGEVFRDITTTAQHPVGALVVAPLLDAAGVPHATPELFVMPDDPRLGEFREFAGTLGLLEVHPARGFAGSEKVLRTVELFGRLEQRTDERIDARAYLRARLMDLLVGDWDRHLNQWRWLRYDDGGQRVWRPVPSDRDEAFSRFDGILPAIGEYYTKFLVSFDETYPPVDKLTFGGRVVDRRILPALDRADWPAVTADVVARVTDEVIADAVRHLPPEVYARDGAMLERALRARRDALPRISDAFYQLLAADPDVYGTEGTDLAVIHRSPDGGVELTLSTCDAGSGRPLGPPYFHRAFRAGETSEIRLYLLGGADRVVDEGDRNEAIRVRVVRGDPAVAARAAAAPRAEATPEDAPGEQDGAEPAGAAAEEDRLTRRYDRFRDWGSDSLVYPQLGYDGTRGLVAGARLERTDYGFGREPFASRMDFAAAWSTGLSEPRLEYKLDVRTPSPLGAVAYVAYTGLDYASYFGLGNRTSRESSLVSHDYYRVTEHRFVVRPLATAQLAGPLQARAGFAFERFSNSADRSSSPASGAYGSGKMWLGSTEAGLRLDTRHGVLTRLRGVMADVSVRHYPAWLDNADGFTKLRAEGRVDLGSPDASPVLVGLRLAGEKNWGRYPYFEAATIGGGALPLLPLDVAGGSTGNLLRGYDLDRFAGDSSVVANADLLVPLGRYSAIVPLRYGLLGLADVGRVFLSGESSSKWHPAAGGGVWVAMRAAGSGMEYVTAISLAVVRSDEQTAFYLTSRLGF